MLNQITDCQLVVNCQDTFQLSMDSLLSYRYFGKKRLANVLKVLIVNAHRMFCSHCIVDLGDPEIDHPFLQADFGGG